MVCSEIFCQAPIVDLYGKPIVPGISLLISGFDHQLLEATSAPLIEQCRKAARAEAGGVVSRRQFDLR